jgi:hypothetical protein
LGSERSSEATFVDLFTRAAQKRGSKEAANEAGMEEVR